MLAMTKRTYVVGAMLIGIGVGLFVAYHNGGGGNTVQKVYVVSKPTELSGLPPHSIHNYETKPPAQSDGESVVSKVMPKPYKPSPDNNCIATIPEQYITNGEQPIGIADDAELMKLEDNAVTCLYHRYVTTLQYFCGYKERNGQIPRNGWYICADPSFVPRNNCVVFSSNKKFNDNLFLSDVKARYNCRTFLTPLSQTDSLQSWMTKNDLKTNVVDVLTLSISSQTELQIIDKMVEEQSVGKVKQLLLELHFDPTVTKKADYVSILKRLNMLYRAGLRIIWYDRVFQCASSNKFNKCYAVYFVQKSLADKTQTFKELSLPPEDEIRKMKAPEISDLYYRYLMTTQFFCKQIVRIGKVTDGGWDVCHDMMQKINLKNCIVYSFGINNDFSFDDDMANTYNCNLYSFDPTMNKGNFKHAERVWFYNRGIGAEYRKYGSGDIAPLDMIRKDLKHEKVPIAVMKGDTEGAEWPSTPQMLRTNQLADVSQFYLEFHSNGMAADHLITLKKMHDAGFRIFWFHTNPACSFKASIGQRSQCMEVYFMNTRYPFNS
ncbi:uncharacterized protein LOC111122728 [Crassostrea virginica]